MSFLHHKALSEKILHFTLAVSILLGAIWAIPAKASWRIAPVKLSFDASSRSDVVTITNDGDTSLSLEVSAMQWLQDEDGKDQYHPTTEVIFFPKQLEVAPNGERVIRVGIRVPSVNNEKAYRLFIKEVPDRTQSTPNTVSISVQFGIPVFVKPIEEKIAGAITEADIVNGKASVRVENFGNSHFRIHSIIFNGKSETGISLFSQEVKGWYILKGNSRIFSTEIPYGLCRQAKEVGIKAIADRIEFSGQIDVDQSMCTAH